MDGPQPLTLQAARPSRPPILLSPSAGRSGQSRWKAGWGTNRPLSQPEKLGHREGSWESRHTQDMAPGRLTQEEHVPDEHPGRPEEVTDGHRGHFYKPELSICFILLS